MLSEDLKPYERMVYPTLQSAWSSGKGLILFMGLFLVELGAGIFLAASILNSLWGQIAGWLICGAIGGGCHFLFLGHPFRIYRAIRKPGSSWISRGLFIISLFQLLGFIQIVTSFFSMPLEGNRSHPQDRRFWQKVLLPAIEKESLALLVTLFYLDNF